ncbi:MAG: ABC transporter substrate-binding protein [Bacillota bacterium]
MKKSKLMSLFVVLALIISMLAGCGGSKQGTSSEQPADGQQEAKEVKITLLNSKAEIQAQLEEAAITFAQENPGITLEVIACPAGQSPFERVSSMYASGNAPTLAVLDGGDLPKLKEKFGDLSGEKWVGDAAERTLNDATIDGKLVAFPLTVEGYGFIYNKAVLDKAFGGSFDPASIKTTKDLEEAFKKVETAGAAPLVVSPMDWSLGAHYLAIAYADQSKDPAEVAKFIQDLRAGSVDLAGNAVFNGLIDTFDVMKKYNLDKNDPLSGTYEKGPEVLGKGTVGFWFMGNWAWPNIQSFDTANGAYGFLPVPISNNADDYGNAGIVAGVTKFVGLDIEQNSQEQQDAAKKFLNWLVYEKSGQEVLVTKANIIPAFNNITLEPADPLGKSIKQYLSNGQTLQFMATLPSDHWAKVGASMQKYLSDHTDRKGLFNEIQEYWKSVQ